MSMQFPQFTGIRSRIPALPCWAIQRLLPLIFAVAGCAQTGASGSTAPPMPAPSASAAVPAAILLEPPERIGQFTLTDTRRFPDLSAGVRYRYAGAGALRPDVFVYPAPPNVEQPGVRDTLAYESEKFRQALAVMQQRGTYQSFQILSETESDIRTPAGPVTGRRVSAVLTQDGQRLDSHQVLFLIRGQFVKVRVTQSAGAASSEELFEFLRGLLTVLTAESCQGRCETSRTQL